MSEKFLKKQVQKQENTQISQKLRENDQLTEEEMEQIVGGQSGGDLSDGSVLELRDHIIR
ncbi:MAG: bacteriocin [Acidaminococcaceae bacterium]|nr:bacteriocin [Acidaminococcaceae bacterium]